MGTRGNNIMVHYDSLAYWQLGFFFLSSFLFLSFSVSVLSRYVTREKKKKKCHELTWKILQPTKGIDITYTYMPHQKKKKKEKGREGREREESSKCTFSRGGGGRIEGRGTSSGVDGSLPKGEPPLEVPLANNIAC